MKNLSKAIVLSLASLCAAAPYTYQSAMAETSSAYTVQVDHQEAQMFAAAMQSAARDWLALSQDLERRYGQGQIRRSTLDAAIRNARLFQDGTYKVAPLIDQRNYAAALEELDNMAAAFSLVRSSHQTLNREVLALSRTATSPAEQAEFIRVRRDLDDRFGRIRTLYYGLGNLLSTGSVY